MLGARSAGISGAGQHQPEAGADVRRYQFEAAAVRGRDAERQREPEAAARRRRRHERLENPASRDRKSTRLNSSHVEISYAVFCLKKKKTRYSRRDCE